MSDALILIGIVILFLTVAGCTIFLSFCAQVIASKQDEIYADIKKLLGK